MITRPLKRALLAAPGVGASLLPKLTCPVCWPAYTGLVSSLGLGFLVSGRYLFAFTATLLLISVGALAFRAKGRRGYGPAALGLVAAAVVLVSKFLVESSPAIYAGLGLLIAASVWNSWPRPHNTLSGSHLVQLSERNE